MKCHYGVMFWQWMSSQYLLRTLSAHSSFSCQIPHWSWPTVFYFPQRAVIIPTRWMQRCMSTTANYWPRTNDNPHSHTGFKSICKTARKDTHNTTFILNYSTRDAKLESTSKLSSSRVCLKFNKLRPHSHTSTENPSSIGRQRIWQEVNKCPTFKGTIYSNCVTISNFYRNE